jgi:hypothetical protein
LPSGAIQDGMIKLINPETGRTIWRKATSGLKLDINGQPTGKDFEQKQLKAKPRHNPKIIPRRKKSHAPTVSEKKARAKAESQKEE